MRDPRYVLAPVGSFEKHAGLRTALSSLTRRISGDVPKVPTPAATQAGHLGSVMPTPEALRAKYKGVTPDQFRAQYNADLAGTARFKTKPGHTDATRGVESYITPGGLFRRSRVSDSGLAYMHAAEQRAGTVAAYPHASRRAHDTLSVQGGTRGVENALADRDIHGNLASDEVMQSGAALSRMVPRDEATKALWARINATAQRMPAPDAGGGALERARRQAAAAHASVAADQTAVPTVVPAARRELADAATVPPMRLRRQAPTAQAG